MPALAPALREDGDDALVLVVEGRALFVVPACWFVEDRPLDDKPADDRRVDDKPLDDGSVVYFPAMQYLVTCKSCMESVQGEPTPWDHTYRIRGREDDGESEEVQSHSGSLRLNPRGGRIRSSHEHARHDYLAVGGMR